MRILNIFVSWYCLLVSFYIEHLPWVRKCNLLHRRNRILRKMNFRKFGKDQKKPGCIGHSRFGEVKMKSNLRRQGKHQSKYGEIKDVKKRSQAKNLHG